MASINSVTNPVWTISISEAYALVQGIDAVKQSIQILLETEKGSQPLMPDFGINLSSFLGKPITAALSDLFTDIRFQIEKYEKRAKVRNITQQANADGSYTVNVFWEYNQITQSNTITI